LFDFILTLASSACWKSATYASITGNYTGTSYIKNDYLGDWIVIKFPYKIVLTRFRFYNQLIVRAPSLWKCYGSNDGINFTEITEASNNLSPLTSNNYASGYFENIIPPTFDIPYLFIGVNELILFDPFANVKL